MILIMLNFCSKGVTLIIQTCIKKYCMAMKIFLNLDGLKNLKGQLFMTTVTRREFGKLSSGESVYLYELKNKNGAYVQISEFGGAIRAICVPDKNGALTDVALGYDDASGYEAQTKYIGALIGRHGNRIEDARFELNGKTYSLEKNDGRNNLHGGSRGFDKRLWRSQTDGESLLLTYRSEDGEEGFPGRLDVTVKYSFDDNNTLIIDYSAVSDADTVCNLTNHCYFNLDGQGSGSIEGHLLKINASHFTVGNSECLPTGYVAKVENTPLDFTDFHTVGERISSPYEQLVFAGGYDHNFCIDGDGFRKAATLKAASSGIVMEVYTDLPGMQFYSGNFLDGTAPFGKGGVPIEKRSGLCLETQFYPNSLRFDNFEKPILKAGQIYHHVTAYSFSMEK